MTRRSRRRWLVGLLMASGCGVAFSGEETGTGASSSTTTTTGAGGDGSGGAPTTGAGGELTGGGGLGSGGDGGDDCGGSLDSDQTCGACLNDCTADGGTCTLQSNGTRVCSCTPASDCGPGAMCEPDGRCKCYPNGVPGNHCAHGEKCVDDMCTCNGSDNCDDTSAPDGEDWEVCCPSGCANLRTDAMNCGACQHACDPPQTCIAGSCR